MTKDEALKKCLRVLEPIAEQRMYEAQWVDSAIKACQEALEQPKEPKYLYVYESMAGITFSKHKGTATFCIGKIKLESDE